MDVEMHQLTLSDRSATGEEVWSCPSCERRLLVTWQPDFRRTVLARGDDNVRHSAAKGPIGSGSVGLGSVSVTSTPAEAELRWLRHSGIDWDGLAGPETRSA